MCPIEGKEHWQDTDASDHLHFRLLIGKNFWSVIQTRVFWHISFEDCGRDLELATSTVASQDLRLASRNIQSARQNKQVAGGAPCQRRTEYRSRPT